MQMRPGRRAGGSDVPDEPAARDALAGRDEVPRQVRVPRDRAVVMADLDGDAAPRGRAARVEPSVVVVDGDNAALERVDRRAGYGHAVDAGVDPVAFESGRDDPEAARDPPLL